MVLPGSAAASASAIWFSRRGVRGVAQISHQDYQYQQPAVAPPTFRSAQQLAQLTPPPQWSVARPQNSITDSISRKIREKFSTNETQMNELLAELNKDVFWSKYATLTELAQIESKSDIMKIVRTFLFISKKSIYLFSNFSRKIIANINDYSVSELAEIVNAFAQLGFLEESFCVQIANRVVANASKCPPNDLVLLFDGYASTRCHMSIVNEELTDSIRTGIPELSTSNLSLLSSCLARLNLKDEDLLKKIEIEFAKKTEKFSPSIVDEMFPTVTARDVTLTAYAFAKTLKSETSISFQTKLIDLSKLLIRDFTAKELEMISTAFDRWCVCDKTIFGDISVQAQRRIAQFSADTLIALLRSFVSQSVLDDALVTRVVCQLPRLSQTLKPSEVVQFWTVFKDGRISSLSAMEVLRPLTVMRAGTFSVTEWLALLDASSTIAPVSVNQEILDSFTLISELPAKYKGTLTPVSSTILEKMTTEQIVDVIKSVVRMKLVDTSRSISLLMTHICQQSLAPSEASDLYCALVALNAHETHKGEMIKLMSQALKV